MYFSLHVSGQRSISKCTPVQVLTQRVAPRSRLYLTNDHQNWKERELGIIVTSQETPVSQWEIHDKVWFLTAGIVA